MLHKSVLLVLLFTFAFLAQTNAQNNADAAEKRSLARELVALTTAGMGLEQFEKVLGYKQRDYFYLVLSEIIEEDKSLTLEDRGKIMDTLSGGDNLPDLFTRYADRYRAEFVKRIDFTKTLEEVSIAVYEKLYTTADMKKILAFYKSPPGNKFCKMSEEAYTGIVKNLGEKLQPVYEKLEMELKDEMRRETEPKINEAKMRLKQPEPK